MDFDAELESLAIRLSDDPEAKALIEGHADDSGARGYNNTLSLERAEAIKRRLVQQYAVNPDQIELIGFGEDLPSKMHQKSSPKIGVRLFWSNNYGITQVSAPCATPWR